MKKLFPALIITAAVLLCGCRSTPNSRTSGSEPAVSPTPPLNISKDLDLDTVLPAAPAAAPTSQSLVVPVDPAEIAEANSGDVIEIREKMFIAQTNDIYLNAEDYFGKPIKYQGFFVQSYWDETDTTYCFVLRNGPGCCPGVDNTAGFEIVWDGGYPQDDDWCEVTGLLEEYTEDGEPYLRLRLKSLTVLDERGAEYVNS
jgi:uncharacterized membrane protein YcgQ (UPF0703/DUF1980 family)